MPCTSGPYVSIASPPFYLAMLPGTWDAGNRPVAIAYFVGRGLVLESA